MKKVIFLLISMLSTLQNAKLSRLDRIRHRADSAGPLPPRGRNGRRGQPAVCALVVIGVGSLSLGASGPVAAGGALQCYEIPAQSLNDALMKFAAQSGLTLLFDASLVKGLKSQALSATLSPQDAMRILLGGTGLGYRFVDAHTVTVQGAAPVDAPALPEHAVPLATVTVLGGHGEKARERVTALHSTNPPMEIPQSTSVVTRELMVQQQVRSVGESLKNVSGVVPGSSNLTPSFEPTLLRGFRAEHAVDGFTQNYNPGDRESDVNIERIEVLKGVNAIFFGGGSGSPAGGMVNLVSKLPHARRAATVGASLGSYAYYQPYFDVNQPLAEFARFRVTGQYTHAGSYIDGVQTQRYNLNPALVLTDGDSNTLTLQSKFSRWEQPDYLGLPATGTVSGNFAIPRSTFIGPDKVGNSTSQFNGVWGTLEHRFDAGWTATVRARYAESDFDQTTQGIVGQDGFEANLPAVSPSTWLLSNIRLYQEQRESSVLAYASREFRTEQSRHALVLGGDYSSFSDQGFLKLDAVPIGSVDLTVPSFPIPYRDPQFPFNQPSVRNTTYGGFAQLQSTFFGRLHLLMSARFGAIRIAYVDPAQKVNEALVTESTRVLPRVGASLDVTDWLTPFVSFGEGMRGQPFVSFVGRPEPELSRQIEGGFKLQFGDAVSGQIAAYRIERSQVGIADPGDPLGRALPNGSQYSIGQEAEINWKLNERMNLLATYSHTEAYNQGGGGAQAGWLAGVPEHSGRLWGNYRFAGEWLDGLQFGLGLYFQTPARISNTSAFVSDGFVTVDTALGYEIGRFRLGLSIKNLLDDRYFERLNYLGSRVTPGQPRSVYFTVSTGF